jgi:hypothetical protein
VCLTLKTEAIITNAPQKLNNNKDIKIEKTVAKPFSFSIYSKPEVEWATTVVLNHETTPIGSFVTHTVTELVE